MKTTLRYHQNHINEIWQIATKWLNGKKKEGKTRSITNLGSLSCFKIFVVKSYVPYLSTALSGPLEQHWQWSWTFVSLKGHESRHCQSLALAPPLWITFSSFNVTYSCACTKRQKSYFGPHCFDKQTDFCIRPDINPFNPTFLAHIKHTIVCYEDLHHFTQMFSFRTKLGCV